MNKGLANLMQQAGLNLINTYYLYEVGLNSNPLQYIGLVELQIYLDLSSIIF